MCLGSVVKGGIVTTFCVQQGCTRLANFLPFMPLSVFSLSMEMCQIFQQLQKPTEAIVILQKVTVLVLRVFSIFAGGLCM